LKNVSFEEEKKTKLLYIRHFVGNITENMQHYIKYTPVQTGPGAHPASCKMGIGSLPGVKCGWGVLLTTHLLLMPRSRKGRAIPLPTLEAI
jgi:hypothetical protein